MTKPLIQKPILLIVEDDKGLQSQLRWHFDQYETIFKELVELCEDYWYILRIESTLFCHLPSRMFGKTDPQLVEPITKSFNLKMVVISIIGFLISNQDYTF